MLSSKFSLLSKNIEDLKLAQATPKGIEHMIIVFVSSYCE
jgi:hypothetical protein